MNTLRPATSHHRQDAQRSMHRWLQLAPVDESCFLSNLCSSLKEGWACNSEKYEAGVTQQPFGSHFTSSAPLWTVRFVLFSQRAFLHSSQGRSRLCPWDTVACCLARVAEGVVLWDGKEHVMLTWVVKPQHTWENAPLYPLTPTPFLQIITPNCGNFQSYLCLNTWRVSAPKLHK